MAINTATYHQTNWRLTQALGDKLNAGDATFSPIGFEGLYLLVKQFPHPVVTPGPEIEVPFAGGGAYYEQSPLKCNFTGQITFLETAAGTVKQFASDVIAGGGFFDARIFEGTPQRYLRSYLLERCFFQMDPSDRDWENRAQVLSLSGTLFGMYFGDTRPGNV